MIPHAAFSLHGNILRYRGEDVAKLLTPYSHITELFLHALHSLPDDDTDAMELDIADLEQKLDYLRGEVLKAILSINDKHTTLKILTKITTDAD